MENRLNNQSEGVSRFIRGIILVLVSLIISVISVSFAVHHMRLKFEEEYRNISDKKLQMVTDIVKMTINGDELLADSAMAAQKYSNVLSLMLVDTKVDDLSNESYALFSYAEGKLNLLLSYGSDSKDNFELGKLDVSSWLSSDNSVVTFEEESYESIIVPIEDSSGRCVGAFEIKTTYGKLAKLGDTLEDRILISVIITIICGVFMYLIHLFIPKLISSTTSGGKKL